ncbi:hypothetical protein Pmar_PMAR017824 [Perkinsus marinus ATCC 50983]|uniref:Integrase zinc-binding domain-containing protein n=1 Tax=Perkinsus marinus (strain ATCC 50983 / TXsc) TaxID=423536 RepID=C5KPN7_PERM5|nr:hypothetical protein Pmar_PMAR017824 [Perkinsus marinus ATCC 50983]EER13556.1 hypothetical protein Pmar_PMAR017824 [Perkinsus marinus ATCC 50983]|eukprot:XP_002781761.1 hypothetical protein Pmar_PMAR017824 [Perkinsus marinus ATCC 50983]
MNNNDEDLFSGKTAIKARRFRAWQMEMSEFDYVNIRMAHVPGVCNVLSDLFSRCAERLEQSHMTPVDEMANEAPTMPIYLPTYGEAQEEDGDNTVGHIYTGAIYDYELSHLAMTPSQAEIIADSYAVDETMYLSVRLKAVWAAANGLLDSETYSDITSVEKAKAVAWIEARKFITSLICKENGAMGLFTQSTNREQDLRKLPWVLVIPGPAVFVNELRLVTAYDPQQQLQSARQGLLLYAHDCKIHVPYDRALRVLQAIAWWPGMGSDLLTHINDCDLCLRLYPSKHLPYRGVTSCETIAVSPCHLEVRREEVDRTRATPAVEGTVDPAKLKEGDCVLVRLVTDKYTEGYLERPIGGYRAASTFK